MYEEFLTAFKKAFRDVDQVNEALNDLGRLRQGNKGAEEHTMTFRLLVGKAGISSTRNPNHRVLIDLYQKSLKPKLVERIMSMENIPETIEEWCEKAILFDNNWWRLMTTMGCTPQNDQNSGQNRNYQNQSQNRDSNAMDINAMSPEHQKLFKEGKCFNCQKPGHRSRDCDQPRKKRFPRIITTTPHQLPNCSSKLPRKLMHTSDPCLPTYQKNKQPKSLTWLKKRVFKAEICLNVSLSYAIHLLCNTS